MKIFYAGYNFIDGNRLVPAFKELNFNSDENYYAKLKAVLKIKRAKNLPLVRVGKIFDGGYVMVDDFRQGGGTRTLSAFPMKFRGTPTWQIAATKFLCTI